MHCPRCHAEQEDGLTECQACGVVFERYRPRSVEAPPVESWWRMGLEWLLARMFEIEPGASRSAVLGRACFLVLLALWGIRLLLLPIEGEELGGSFMHLINLPFHEAGHFVFSPFGRFIHVLGGTLGQLLVPLMVVGSFLGKSNPFGAVVGVWWLGESFMDCAPYIGDARAGELMLLGGVTGQEMPDYHDWEVLLSRTGLLAYDHVLAKTFWTVGMLLLLASLAWGGFILWRQWRTAAESNSGSIA
jgi:hypothetical protein